MQHSAIFERGRYYTGIPSMDNLSNRRLVAAPVQTYAFHEPVGD